MFLDSYIRHEWKTTYRCFSVIKKKTPAEFYVAAVPRTVVSLPLEILRSDINKRNNILADRNSNKIIKYCQKLCVVSTLGPCGPSQDATYYVRTKIVVTLQSCVNKLDNILHINNT